MTRKLSPACKRTYLLFVALLFVIRPLHAEVKLPAIFGDHMVLQQDIKVPVWGTAEPGEKVTVIVGDHAGAATADGEGRWRIDLPPFAPNPQRLIMTVMGKNLIRLEDVLIGDVWVASGQSNMEYPLQGAHNFKDVAEYLNDDQLRIFMVDHAYALGASHLGGRDHASREQGHPEYSKVIAADQANVGGRRARATLGAAGDFEISLQAYEGGHGGKRARDRDQARYVL